MAEQIGASRTLTYSAALNEALREEMHRDPTVVVFGEDISVWGEDGGVFGVTKGLAKDFGPERVRDTPVSEEGIVAIGVGAAAGGLRPVVELMYFDFVTLAMDPLVNQAAKLRYMFGGQTAVPLVVRSNIGASGGKAAQHSQSLESWFIHTPGLKVAVPSTPSDAKGLLKTAIRDDNPVVFLEHKMLYFTKGAVLPGDECLAFGQAAIRRVGTDVTVVATQAMLDVVADAAESLARDGIELEIIDPRTLVPLDIERIVESVRTTNRLLICHEAVERGGWAGEVAMQVMENAFDYLDAPIARVCGANVPMPYSAPLEEAVLPQAADVVDAIQAMLGVKSSGAVRAKPTGVTPTPQDHEPRTNEAGSRRAHNGRLVEVLVPRLSDTMEVGTVGEWQKAPGDRIAAGEPIVEIETDKATVVLEGEVAGVIEEIFAASGEDVLVGTVLATIVADHNQRA
jgi:pyruvate/2-oxoglutarate/acetoin dehydrogenase E1 component